MREYLADIQIQTQRLIDRIFESNRSDSELRNLYTAAISALYSEMEDKSIEFIKIQHNSDFERGINEAVSDLNLDSDIDYQSALETSQEGAFNGFLSTIERSSNYKSSLAEQAVAYRGFEFFRQLGVSDGLQQNGIRKANEFFFSTVDKNGNQRRLKYDNYLDIAEDLTGKRAFLEAKAYVFTENNIDLAVIPTNPATTDSCLSYEGMVVSISGDRAGESLNGRIIRSLIDLYDPSEHIFHPNCNHFNILPYLG